MNLILPQTPEERAKSLIEEYGILNPGKLDLEELSFAENLVVKETGSDNFMGMINYRNNFGIISISSRITEPGAKRFTLAHELGHFFNEKDFNKNSLHNCNAPDIHFFKTKKQLENEANKFAGELLLYKPWFGEYINKRKINMELIKDISGYFDVSLTSAAIRYASIGKYPAAVILSSNGKVKWSCINEYFPFKWIPNGYKVREESAAYDYFAGNEVQTCEDLMPAHVWFSDDRKVDKSTYLYEQNFVMNNYKSVLTLLWESER